MGLIDINTDNVAQTGFFCYMSKRKTEGYRRKLVWVTARFGEGMHIKMLDLSLGERGFIEYIPGEHAWRPVFADGYMFIHCLWVVGKSKGKGFGALLLDACIRDAKAAGMDGVAMLTSEGNWLAGKRLLVSQGFEVVDQAPPSFSLLVKRFGGAPPPSLPSDWDERAARFGAGVTVIRTDQCPYLEDAVKSVAEVAEQRGLPLNVVEFQSSAQVRQRAPSPYGTYSVLLNGRVVGYDYLAGQELQKLL
jgi:N-acetylglutamate synthase-like GNAT family acetyltransferase